LPLNNVKKEKLINLLNNNLSKNLSDVFLKNLSIQKNHNYIILEELEKH
jgi:hypothetical protein